MRSDSWRRCGPATVTNEGICKPKPSTTGSIFRAALSRPQQLEGVVGRLRSNITEAGVRRARAIEERLYDQTWLSAGYDLVPALAGLDIPTLVLHGDSDLIPLEAVAHIAEAMPRGRLSVLPGCGHFAYLERPDLVGRNIAALLSKT